MLITISRTLENDIINFVRLNNIENINDFLANCLRDGFNIAKYGNSPIDNFNKENKPFKIENYDDSKKESNSEGFDEKKAEGSKADSSSGKEESILQKQEEVLKPKRKIKIIKK